jgi:hypothetical protein
MITLDTLRALHEHDHTLAASCPACRSWAVLDLERLTAEGRGDYVFVGRKPRCSQTRLREVVDFRLQLPNPLASNIRTEPRCFADGDASVDDDGCRFHDAEPRGTLASTLRTRGYEFLP